MSSADWRIEDGSMKPLAIATAAHGLAFLIGLLLLVASALRALLLEIADEFNASRNENHKGATMIRGGKSDSVSRMKTAVELLPTCIGAETESQRAARILATLGEARSTAEKWAAPARRSA